MGNERLWARDDIEALYRAHGFAVFRRCRRLLGDEAAHDVTQEIFLDLVARPSAFRGQSRPSTYLFAAATSACLRRLRDEGRRSEAWLDGVLAASASAAPGPEEALAARQALAALLADQDEVTAQIALYHFVDGLSQGEIGELVGLSRVSVNQRLSRLRAQAQAPER